MSPRWEYLGEGTYNDAYVNSSRTKVLKIQKKNVESDSPSRSVRLWNQINSNISPLAEIYNYGGIDGWVCPFIEGRQANDSEMRDAVIEIFNSSGRIVVDATALKNFITTNSGEVICVDIGMALQLERRESAFYSDESNRRKSIVSLDIWNDCVDKFQPFFKKDKFEYPETINTIKALLFIKSNRPDTLNADFLKGNFTLTKELAKAYDIQHKYNREMHNGTVSPVEYLNRSVGTSEDFDRDEKVISTPPDIQYENALKILDKAVYENENLDREGKVERTSPDLEKDENMLSEEQSKTLTNIKKSCQNELGNYIKSRGSLNDSGIFSSNLNTLMFRNIGLTKIKIEYVKSLIYSINKASSTEELRELIAHRLKTSSLAKSNFSSGLMKSIKLCKDIISTAFEQKPEDTSSYSPK